jgi:hypothetical protein
MWVQASADAEVTKLQFFSFYEEVEIATAATNCLSRILQFSSFSEEVKISLWLSDFWLLLMIIVLF